MGELRRPQTESRADKRTQYFLQGEHRRSMQSFLWQRWNCEKGEIHSDPVSPGCLAALLLLSTAHDTGGVPPEQPVPLHMEACWGQGKSQHITTDPG